MNLDTIAFATPSTITTNTEEGTTEQLSDITLMPLECLNLIGGGSGIVLLG
jgi:hypothetical protein